MRKMFVCCAAMIVVLAACGGSETVTSGGGSGSRPLVIAPPVPAPAPTMLSPAPAGSFNALVNRETTLANRFFDQNAAIKSTWRTEMPTNGAVTYTGTAAFPSGNRILEAKTTSGTTVISLPVPEIAGQAVMTVRFRQGNVSGTIDQFRDAANTPLPGSLTLEPAPIIGATFGGGSVTGTYPVDGIAQNVQSQGYSGQFVGPKAAGMAGIMDFTVPQAGGGTTPVDGSFIVAQ